MKITLASVLGSLAIALVLSTNSGVMNKESALATETQTRFQLAQKSCPKGTYWDNRARTCVKG